MADKIIDALRKKALGYDVKETVEEFSGENAELIKRKVSLKHIPPDVSALKAYLDMRSESAYSNLSDEELKKEKERLLIILNGVKGEQQTSENEKTAEEKQKNSGTKSKNGATANGEKTNTRASTAKMGGTKTVGAKSTTKASGVKSTVKSKSTEKTSGIKTSGAKGKNTAESKSTAKGSASTKTSAIKAKSCANNATEKNLKKAEVERKEGEKNEIV